MSAIIRARQSADVLTRMLAHGQIGKDEERAISEARFALRGLAAEMETLTHVVAEREAAASVQLNAPSATSWHLHDLKPGMTLVFGYRPDGSVRTVEIR